MTWPLLALILGSLLSYPPLTPEQFTRLETARDGGDHREEAFFALLENSLLSQGQIGDQPVRLHPDLSAMIENPGKYRGDLCLLSGVIQQQTILGGFDVMVREVFLRDDQGRPFLIYVVQADNGSDPPSALSDGTTIEIAGRFYKRVDATARDGTHMSYAAFVGSHPRILLAISPPEGLTHLWIVALPVGGMLVVFTLLFFYIRHTRKGQRPRHGRASSGDESADEGGALPEDPIEALSELKHRADEGSSRSEEESP